MALYTLPIASSPCLSLPNPHPLGRSAATDIIAITPVSMACEFYLMGVIPCISCEKIIPAFHVNYSKNRQNTHLQPENIRGLSGLVFAHWVKGKSG
jgi:hypothetical protein